MDRHNIRGAWFETGSGLVPFKLASEVAAPSAGLDWLPHAMDRIAVSNNRMIIYIYYPMGSESAAMSANTVS